MAQIQFLKIIKTLFTASILSILENAPCAFEKSFSLDVPQYIFSLVQPLKSLIGFHTSSGYSVKPQNFTLCIQEEELAKKLSEFLQRSMGLLFYKSPFFESSPRTSRQI